jgi:glycosyltransferase involved in cell wall biosynthesis
MKIACISTSRIPSDTANSIQVMKACQALKRLGHEPHLLAPGDRPAGPDWPSLAEQYGLAETWPITWLPANPALKRNDFAWSAVRRARGLGAEMIYTWTGQSAVFGLLAGLPVVYEVHDLPTGRFGPVWFRTFLKLKGQKRLLVITRALQGKLAQRYGDLTGREVVIAPNGVDLEQYAHLPEAPEARQTLGLPQCPTVLCAGHLYAGRGVDLFMRLAARFPQASFVWVGGRPEDVAAYRAKASQAGLRNVTLTGFVGQRQVPWYQAAADILLMPYDRSIAGSSGGNSADICSPMKMFDYLAAGRAILSSDLPVFHEVLNATNAVFAPPEDLDGWSAVLQQLLTDPALRERLSAQARRDAEGYSWLARAQRALAGFPGK